MMALVLISRAALLVPIVLTGCSPYPNLVRGHASTELRCPENQIDVEQTTTSGYPVRFTTNGCGQRARYACWDRAAPAQSFSERQRSDPGCTLTESSTRPAQPLTPAEGQCRRVCRDTARSCSQGCRLDSFACATFCESFESGCLDGCRRASEQQGE
jgi:hypothetical protein